MATTKRKAHKRARKGARQAPKGEALRRAELLQIAADLFADRGYVATTVRDIADQAGSCPAASTAETLSSYEAVIAEGEGPKETFEGLVQASLGAISGQRSGTLIYQNEARYLASDPRFDYLTEAQHKFERIWTGVLKEGVRSGEFRENIDPRLVYRLVRDAVWTAPRWFPPGESMKPEHICEQYLAVLVEGVSKH